MQVRADASSWVVTAATLTSEAGRATRSRLISWLTLSVKGTAEDRRAEDGPIDRNPRGWLKGGDVTLSTRLTPRTREPAARSRS